MHRRFKNRDRNYGKEAADLIRPLIGVKIEEKVGENKDEDPRFTTLEHGNRAVRRNSDGTITNDFVYSQNMNRFVAPERPYGHKPELWTGIDVMKYHRKNNHLIHVTGIFMASICALLAYAIEYYLGLQSDFYVTWGTFKGAQTFQHLPEIKYMYIGIRPDTPDMGYNPGWWPAWMCIATNVLGMVEVSFAKRGYSWFFLNRLIWVMAVTTIILGIPVYINNFSAVCHQGFIAYSWGFGYRDFSLLGINNAPVRNRSGYCHMVNHTYYERIIPKYVTPPEIRHCRDLTCYHIIGMMFAFYTTIVAYTVIRVVRVPAWGGWPKKKLVGYGLGTWTYSGP